MNKTPYLLRPTVLETNRRAALDRLSVKRVLTLSVRWLEHPPIFFVVGRIESGHLLLTRSLGVVVPVRVKPAHSVHQRTTMSIMLGWTIDWMESAADKYALLSRVVVPDLHLHTVPNVRILSTWATTLMPWPWRHVTRSVACSVARSVAPTMATASLFTDLHREHVRSEGRMRRKRTDDAKERSRTPLDHTNSKRRRR
jgi:hypothetical protein